MATTPFINSDSMQAWSNWWDFWYKEQGGKFTGHDDGVGGYRAFEQFMGQNIFREPLTPEAAHRLRLLLSPHHYAILKAYKAKQEVS